jgi:Helix-turn-helix domain
MMRVSSVRGPETRTAAPVASRRGGVKQHVTESTQRAASLPDKAAMAAEIAADWRLGTGDKLVALVLLFRFHNTKTGQCNPSYERLAEACCLRRRAIIKIIPRLEAAGWLIVDRTAGGRNRRNQFRFKLLQPETVTPWTLFESDTVNAETEKGELPFTPDGEPAFTRIERGNLNAGNERRNLSRSSESFEKREATAAELTAGAERYAQQCREHGAEQRFIKHPTTWLNAGCWLDEPEPNEERTKIFHRDRSLVAGLLHAGSLGPWGQP